MARKALEIALDYPILATIRVRGGEVSGPARVNAGHILGKLASIRRWGSGADESRKEVSWTVRGEGPMEVTLEAWAKRAGRVERSLAIEAADGRSLR